MPRQQLNKVRNHVRNPGVAANRQEIYKEVIDRYKLSMEKEFYLEAVALCESLITDRMESRLGELSRDIVKFGTISDLRKKLLGHGDAPKLENNTTLEGLYNRICSDWAGKRNKAVHQAAKISKANPKDWSEFLNDAKAAAEEGMGHFRALDKELKKIRSQRH